jgi:hypothetical protein
MSATKQLLTILQDEGPLTAEELAAVAGMDLARVRVILAHMRKCSYLEARPMTFAVTPKGEKHSEEIAKPPSVASSKRLQRKKDRQAGITAEMAKEARMRNSMVSQSIQGRPALEKAWGVFACQ